MSDKKIHPFDGEQIDTQWDGRLCIHVGECTRAKGEIFKSGRDPWGEPDRGDADHVAAVVERCPTGALAYRRKDGGPEESPEAKNSVAVVNDGPLFFRGRLEIDGAAEDMPGVAFRAALCRCGDSSNKPFCDNSHRKAGFRDYGAVGETGEKPDSFEGSLTVKRAPNGPLLVNGPFEILNGAGRAAWAGSKAALCRCGKSKNKPFCDGAHKAANFEAE